MQLKLAINEAKKPVILAGKGTKHARESLLALAEQIGAPIVLTLPAKGIIPDEHPLCIGGLGLIGTKPSYEAMKHADTLIMVGTSYPFTGFLPEKAKQFISIQILPKLGNVMRQILV